MKIIFGFIAFFMVSTACFADILIVTHPSVTETALTRREVSDIFLGKKKYWKDNSNIRVALMEDGDLTKGFLVEYLNKTPVQYRKYQQKKVFTGPAKSRLQFRSTSKMIDYVSATPGAIGYVDSSSQTENVLVMAVVD